MGYNAAVLGGFTTIKISQNGDPEMTRLPTFFLRVGEMDSLVPSRFFLRNDLMTFDSPSLNLMIF